MPNLLIRRLEMVSPLSAADRQLLEQATAQVRQVGADQDLICEGDLPRAVPVFLEGFACRYKTLSDGKRQIMAYLVPGDLGDLYIFLLNRMDHSIATLTPCRVAELARETVLEITARHPTLSHALWWAGLVDAAMLREGLTNMGRRPAEQRIGHLLCEMLVRLQVVGLADGNRYELPLTQAELADMMGLSTVHVNRVLQALRRQGLIRRNGKALQILDIDRLIAFSGFNPIYLHLNHGRLNDPTIETASG